MRYESSGEYIAFCLHSQCRGPFCHSYKEEFMAKYLSPETEVMCPYEISVTLYKAIRCHITHDPRFQFITLLGLKSLSSKFRFNIAHSPGRTRLIPRDLSIFCVVVHILESYYSRILGFNSIILQRKVTSSGIIKIVFLVAAGTDLIVTSFSQFW
jgi:hypothetical protein